MNYPGFQKPEKTFSRRAIPRHTHRLTRPRRVFLVVALLLLIGSCVLFGFVASRQIQTRARTFGRELDRAATALDQAGDNPQEAIAQARHHLTNARRALEPFQPLAFFLTGPANDVVDFPGLRQASAWWIFADEASLAADELLQVAWLGTTRLNDDPVAGLLAVTPDLHRRLQTAEHHLRRAQAVRSRLDPGWLPAEVAAQAETALVRWDALLPHWEETLPQAAQLLPVLPAALGSERPLTYLVIIQSSDNLRATGGFLTGVGTLRVEQGRITNVSFHDVTEAEFAAQGSARAGYGSAPIAPPEPLQRYMGLGHWILRDGNWWADFPTTARQVVEFWQLVEPEPIDGVIGLTDQGLSTLLEALGPISLTGGQSLDAANMKAVAGPRIFAKTTPGVNQQSAFFQEVTLELTARLEQLPPGGWLLLATKLQAAARRRDLMIASFDPTPAQTFHRLHFDGAVRGHRDDYLYLVEDNLADSKLSAFVTQSLTYEVQLEPDARPRMARLTIDKANSYTPGTELVGFPGEGYNTGGRWDAQTQRWDKWEGYYGGYLRLFPPPGSQFIEATGFDDRIDVITESDRLIFGGYVGLWAGVRRRLQIGWRPGSQPSCPGHYHLHVQRQPGAPVYPLTIHVSLPPAHRAVAITPAPVSVTEQMVTWQAPLDQDRTFSLRLEP